MSNDYKKAESLRKDLDSLRSKYSFENEDKKSMYRGVSTLLGRVISYMESKDIATKEAVVVETVEEPEEIAPVLKSEEETVFVQYSEDEFKKMAIDNARREHKGLDIDDETIYKETAKKIYGTSWASNLRSIVQKMTGDMGATIDEINDITLENKEDVLHKMYVSSISQKINWGIIK